MNDDLKHFVIGLPDFLNLSLTTTEVRFNVAARHRRYFKEMFRGGSMVKEEGYANAYAPHVCLLHIP